MTQHLDFRALCQRYKMSKPTGRRKIKAGLLPPPDFYLDVLGADRACIGAGRQQPRWTEKRLDAWDAKLILEQRQKAAMMAGLPIPRRRGRPRKAQAQQVEA
jgi:hypothetical protein